MVEFTTCNYCFGQKFIVNVRRLNSPISSMKTMQGWILTANEKTAAVSFWDSPYHLSVSVDACRLMNWHPDALAVALAMRVFPHPGGPNNKTPEENVQRFIFVLFKNNDELTLFTIHCIAYYIFPKDVL